MAGNQSRPVPGAYIPECWMLWSSPLCQGQHTAAVAAASRSLTRPCTAQPLQRHAPPGTVSAGKQAGQAQQCQAGNKTTGTPSNFPTQRQKQELAFHKQQWQYGGAVCLNTSSSPHRRSHFPVVARAAPGCAAKSFKQAGGCQQMSLMHPLNASDDTHPLTETLA